MPKGRAPRLGQRHSGGNLAYRGYPASPPLQVAAGSLSIPQGYSAVGKLPQQLQSTCGSYQPRFSTRMMVNPLSCWVVSETLMNIHADIRMALITCQPKELLRVSFIHHRMV